MVDLNSLANTALERYFTNLSNTGYRKQSDVNRLLVLIFISELIGDSLSCFLTEEDLRVIRNVLDCLYGVNCLIPFPDNYKNRSKIGSYCSN